MTVIETDVVVIKITDEMYERASERANLKKLADEVVGAARGTRTKEGVLKWEKEIRRDRKLADQQWINRWDEAVKKNVSA